jgi:hypothetical protein
MIAAAAVGLACLLGWGGGGCVEYVHDSDRSASYREGSALKLLVRAQPPTTDAQSGSLVVGTWEGDGTFARPPSYSQRYYDLEIRADRTIGSSVRRTEVRSLDDVDGLPAADREFDERHVAMRLQRDAGVLVLDGDKEGKHAAGRVLLEKDADFEAVASALAGRPVEPAEMASLAFADVPRADLESLRAAGQRLDPADLVRAHDKGVTGEYLAALAATGRAFTLDDAVRLRDAGVKASFVHEMQQAGLSPGVDDLVRLRANGVSPAFVHGLRGEGDASAPPSVDEVIRLRNSGVSAQYVTDLRKAGYDLTTDQVVRLSQASVSATYARGVKEAGYNLGVEELIHLRNSGVSVQYMKELQEPGYEPLTVQQIIDARAKGLSAEFVKNLRRRS